MGCRSSRTQCRSGAAAFRPPSTRRPAVRSIIPSMNWKKLGIIALVSFLVYFLVRSPVESANAVKTLGIQIGRFANTLASSVTTFLTTLF